MHPLFAVLASEAIGSRLSALCSRDLFWRSAVPGWRTEIFRNGKRFSQGFMILCVQGRLIFERCYFDCLASGICALRPDVQAGSLFAGKGLHWARDFLMWIRAPACGREE